MEISAGVYYSPSVVSPDILDLPGGSSELEWANGSGPVFSCGRSPVDYAESPPALPILEPVPGMEL